MGKSVQDYHLHGLASSRRKSYNSAKSRFIKFCMASNTVPVPVCENQLCFYVSYLANEGLAHQTIKSYLSAIRHLQISYRHPDPHIGDIPRLELVLSLPRYVKGRSLGSIYLLLQIYYGRHERCGSNCRLITIASCSGRRARYVSLVSSEQARSLYQLTCRLMQEPI